MISSLISFVLVWSCIIDFSKILIFSSTFVFSRSIFFDSFSVYMMEFLSIIYCSFSLFLSFSISYYLSLRKSSSFFIFWSLLVRYSEVSCSFFVSFLTPDISDSIYKISSCFYFISSLIAYNALSLYYIPKSDFYQSSNSVFFDKIIFSISIAASLRVFLAAAVSSFYEMSYAWYKVFCSLSLFISSFIESIRLSWPFFYFSKLTTDSSALYVVLLVTAISDFITSLYSSTYFKVLLSWFSSS